ncbi:MAG TPA: 50S ribosomal protein L29 [Catalimonadaceae bacterium]|nr:50S ribosomal protein L29 [Catalimonadaceae bacterium]
MKNEFKNLSTEQLREKLAELTVMQGKMKFAHGVTALENPMQIRTIRRDIARINTYLSTSK